MAKFQDVMKQWRRMCEKNQSDCMRLCPICANPACGELSEADDEDICIAEVAIMTWAAAHPEPVYPTWIEWLVDIGVIGKYAKLPLEASSTVVVSTTLAEPIPADIAQKLGIEPKETKKRMKDQVCGNDYEQE